MRRGFDDEHPTHRDGRPLGAQLHAVRFAGLAGHECIQASAGRRRQNVALSENVLSSRTRPSLTARIRRNCPVDMSW